MIASVRKFSLSTEGPNGRFHQVLFIHEDKKGNLVYCVAGQDLEQLFIDAKKVTTVKLEN